jgi:hypothetical protein
MQFLVALAQAQDAALRCDELGLEDQIIRIENDCLARTPRSIKSASGEDIGSR